MKWMSRLEVVEQAVGTGQEWSVGECALFSPKARRWGAMSALGFRLSRIGQQSRFTRGLR
jgi:hypothetical protein